MPPSSRFTAARWRRCGGSSRATPPIWAPYGEPTSCSVHEVVSNSIRHGGGAGTLHLWRDDDALVCEVRDGGRIDDPLVGRERPEFGRAGGRGLWLANQLCDLVQVRSFSDGSVVRLHVRLA